MNKFVIFGLFVATAMAVPTPDAKTGSLNCLELEDSMFSCLFVKANDFISRAARSSDIEVIPGITFIRDTPMERSGKSLKTDTEVMAELPRESGDRVMQLITMLYESAEAFLQTHSLKVNLPEQSISRAFGEEIFPGRGKYKKLVLPVIAVVATKLVALLPILFGGLGLLVLKALFVGKIALLIAGVLAFQKFFGSGSSVGSVASSFFNNKNLQPASNYFDAASAPGWNTGSAPAQQPQQGYYKRSFEDDKNAQNLAYSAHAPAAQSS